MAFIYQIISLLKKMNDLLNQWVLKHCMGHKQAVYQKLVLYIREANYIMIQGCVKPYYENVSIERNAIEERKRLCIICNKLKDHDMRNCPYRKI